MRSLLLQILFQSTPLMRGETLRLTPVAALICAFQSTPLSRGETLTAELTSCDLTTFQSAPLSRGETRDPHSRRAGGGDFNPLPSHEGRPAAGDLLFSAPVISIHSPHAREDLLLRDARSDSGRISIHSPHTRGDSISLQKSIRIYVSLHNKTMIHRFSELYKPLFAAQSPIFGVRSPWESHDSFTFARPSDGRGITP